MRKFHSGCMAAALAALMLGSCQSAGNFLNNNPAGSAQGSSAGSDLLGGLLGGLLSNVIPLTPQTIQGSWTYNGPECRFESENALAQAGGIVAANTVKAKLSETYSKIGIKPGACSFVFNADGTCQVILAGQNISGRYSLDAKNHDISISSSTGLIKINGKAYYDGKNLALLFESSKLLAIAQTVTTFTGQGSSTIGALAELLAQYKGMLLGMELARK